MTNDLENRRILVGITGAIAAYKSAELVRLLKCLSADVRVIMTDNACQFITPLTLQALSEHPVYTDVYDKTIKSAMGHIELARWGHVIIIAPASANFIARLRTGLADNLLTNVCLATSSKLLLAPAMNLRMWKNEATQENITILKKRGITLVGPTKGEQACGEFGMGRMSTPEQIIQALNQTLSKVNLLAGLSILVTAGPTQEPIDAVRYLSNRSSGCMGYAIAEAAAVAGAKVTLISGPVSLDPPKNVKTKRVETAAQMHQTVMAHIHDMDIFICAAAVSDYACVEQHSNKIKKQKDPKPLSLILNKDILADVVAKNSPAFTVGFAAETDQLEKNAIKKLHAKKLDMIVANQVGPQLGFGVVENTLQIYWENRKSIIPRAPKQQLAVELISIIGELFYQKHPEKKPTTPAIFK